MPNVKIKASLLFVFIYVLLARTATAQLCNGNLGDPIINLNFGSTHEPTNGTTFSYVNGCPKPGEYTIQNLIFGCGDARETPWHTPLAGDHTRNTDGQYMLVNAGSTRGIIHSDTAKGLCGNTNYEYSAWLANVLQDWSCGGSAVLPNIMFTISKISGETIASISTGNLPIENSKIWKQFGLTFKTPADVDAVIGTLSINPSFGCGSAFIVDDITLRVCGPKVSATIDGNAEAKVCADYTDPFILRGEYDPRFTDPVVQWQSSVNGGEWIDIAGENSLSYHVPRRDSGNIDYRLAVAERANINSLNCRVSSNKIVTEVHPVPPHRMPQSIFGCNDKNLSLPYADVTALEARWQGPNGFSSEDLRAIVPSITYADTGLYILNQMYYYGCKSTDTFFVKVYPSTTLTTQTEYAICEGKSINFSASGTGTFKWTPSDGLSNDAIPNPVATLKDSILYSLMVTNSYGCKDSAYIKVNVYRNPLTDAGPDKTIVAGDTVLLKGSVSGTSINYSWTPANFIDNINTPAPKVFPPENTTYTLHATSNVGCGSSSSSVKINVYNDIFIPNGFSPNGDGINDQFKIFAIDGYKLNKFLIYNRWGNVVFSAKKASDAWDGNAKNEMQPEGTYLYLLEIENSHGKKIIKKGPLTLVR